MGFETLIGTPTEAPAGTKPPLRLTLDQPPFAGQAFGITLGICDNPCCPCGWIEVNCRTEARPDHPVVFDLDLFARQLDTRPHSAPEGVALGRAFLAEARDEEWDWLRKFFFATKRRYMETMNLDALDAELPPEVMAGKSTMVGYHEIFPWAESIAFSLQGEDWIMDDQHCVALNCKCTQAALTFFRVRKKEPLPTKPPRNTTSLHYDFVSGQSRVIESPPGNPAPSDLVQALRAANPDLAKTLRHRHRQLKRLGRRLLAEPAGGSPRDREAAWDKPPAPQPARAPERPGRNDPCPCGSGKKFKKCCGG